MRNSTTKGHGGSKNSWRKMAQGKPRKKITFCYPGITPKQIMYIKMKIPAPPKKVIVCL